MQDIRRQFLIALRWLPLIVIGAIAAGVIAYTFASGQPRIYAATARLIVDPGPDPTTQDLEVAANYVELYARQATSKSMAFGVIEDMKLDETSESLLKRISTTASADDLALEIEVRDGDPEAAQRLAQRLGDEMRQRSRDLAVSDEVRQAEEAIEANRVAIAFSRNRLNNLIRKPIKTPQDRIDILALTTQISSLQADILAFQPSARAFVRNRLDWFERPTVPDSPVEPRPAFWTLLALVVGGMLAAAIGFVIEYLRDKIRDERDLEVATGLTTVGSISEKRGLIKRDDGGRLVLLSDPASKAADTYRNLRVRIALANGTARSLLVASSDDSDGRGVVAANLALAYAESGRNVVLVDADQRSPRLHAFFGVLNDRGLSTAVAYPNAPLGQVTVATPHPKLRLMPAGPRSPGAIDPVGSAQMPDLLGRLLEVADMVVVDAPPISRSLDAAMLATHVQESLLVTASGSRGADIAEAARLLESANANLVGTVLYRQARSLHRRAGVSLPVALHSGRTATTSAATGPSGPPVIIFFVTILYRIFGGPHPRSPATDGTSSQHGQPAVISAPTSQPALAPSKASKAIPASSAHPSSARPSPARPGPPMTIPAGQAYTTTEPPSPGPFAGEFKPPSSSLPTKR